MGWNHQLVRDFRWTQGCYQFLKQDDFQLICDSDLSDWVCQFDNAAAENIPIRRFGYIFFWTTVCKLKP